MRGALRAYTNCDLALANGACDAGDLCIERCPDCSRQNGSKYCGAVAAPQDSNEHRKSGKAGAARGAYILVQKQVTWTATTALCVSRASQDRSFAALWEHAMSTEANGDRVSWVHFGDLHITGENESNYHDFLALIQHVNANLAGQIDFAILPGDNADDGTEDQFRLVEHAVDGLRIPLHILPGDHDRKPGNLDAFYNVLGAERLPKAITVSGYRSLFLDIVSAGTGGPDFRLGADQILWLEHELA